MGVFALAVMIATPAPAADAAGDQKRAEAIVGERCSLCHGKGGESASPVYPRLAGQHSAYLERQYLNFQ